VIVASSVLSSLSSKAIPRAIQNPSRNNAVTGEPESFAPTSIVSTFVSVYDRVTLILFPINVALSPVFVHARTTRFDGARSVSSPFDVLLVSPDQDDRVYWSTLPSRMALMIARAIALSSRTFSSTGMAGGPTSEMHVGNHSASPASYRPDVCINQSC